MASAMVSHHSEIPMSTRRKFEDLKNLICKLALLDLPSDVHELRSRVENELARAINGDEIHLVWSIEDVHETARQMEAHLIEDPDDWKSPLTDEEAREILATTERCHDAIVGVNWDVLAVHTRAVLGEKMKERKQKQALEVLEKIKADLQAKFSHLNVSFGYIGNLERWGDDRSWRFFYIYNPEAGMPAKSFGGYSTDNLPKLADYMQKTGLEVFSKLLDELAGSQ